MWVCRYCGLAAAVSHASVRECIDALHGERNLLRDRLQHHGAMFKAPNRCPIANMPEPRRLGWRSSDKQAARTTSRVAPIGIHRLSTGLLIRLHQRRLWIDDAQARIADIESDARFPLKCLPLIAARARGRHFERAVRRGRGAELRESGTQIGKSIRADGKWSENKRDNQRRKAHVTSP